MGLLVEVHLVCQNLFEVFEYEDSLVVLKCCNF